MNIFSSQIPKQIFCSREKGRERERERNKKNILFLTPKKESEKQN